MERKLFDVVIVGGGIAGLAAALKAQNEGLKSVLLQSGDTIGGQAGMSDSLINMLGFPNGISGQDLAMAGLKQIIAAGAEVKRSFTAHKLIRHDEGPFTVRSLEGEQVHARTVILACGFRPRRLDTKGLSLYLGNGVAYGSPEGKPVLWTKKRAILYGGGNGSMQSCLFFCRLCTGVKTTLIVRAKSLEEISASYQPYLKPGALPNLTIMYGSEIIEILGDGRRFGGVKVKSGDSITRVEADHLNIQVGGIPDTAWLEEESDAARVVHLSNRGFVRTGDDLPEGFWPEGVPILFLQAAPGVFAAGDCRYKNPHPRVVGAGYEGMVAASSALESIMMFKHRN